MQTNGEAWIPAQEAAALLGVSLPTLYSYVSRDLLHPQREPGGRGKRYRRAEVEHLARRHAGVRRPSEVAGATLDFGLPVLESGLCLIRGGRFYYRGQDAVAFSRDARLEDAAALLWDCAPAAFSDAPPLPRTTRDTLATLAGKPMPERLVHGVQAVAESWGLAGAADGGPDVAWRCVQAMVAAATGQPPGSGEPVHAHLARAWKLAPGSADVLRRALVLSADHECNASSFTARCVASTGAAPYFAVLAALGALTGPRHGGMTAQVEALWRRAQAAGASPATLHQWLGELRSVPGFGHRLYPEGDPRATAILECLPPDPLREAVREAGAARTGHAPNLDFALACLVCAVGAPEGAGFALFAIARTVGWLAHAFEQRQAGTLIRPRAAYTGVLPAAQPQTVPAGRIVRRR